MLFRSYESGDHAGQIWFRLRNGETLQVDSGIADWTAEHALLFSRVGTTLSVSVDGVVKGTLTVTLEPDASFIVGAPLRLAGNHVDGNVQSLLARFTRVDATYVPPGLYLNGAAVDASLSGSASKELSGAIVTQDDGWVDVGAATMGAWGTGDFSIEITMQMTAATGWAAGAECGALFIRSTNPKSPFDGPSCFLYESGDHAGQI